MSLYIVGSFEELLLIDKKEALRKNLGTSCCWKVGSFSFCHLKTDPKIWRWLVEWSMDETNKRPVEISDKDHGWDYTYPEGALASSGIRNFD